MLPFWVRSIMLLVTGMLCVSCGGSDQGPSEKASDDSSGTVAGTIAGNAVTVSHATSARLSWESEPLGLLVLLTDDAHPCDRLNGIRDWKDAVGEAKDPVVPGGTAFWFLLRQFDAEGAAAEVAPGVFSLDPPMGPAGATASAVFQKPDAECSFPDEQSYSLAHAGSVEFELADSGSAQGTFTAQMGDQGDMVSGAFDAPYCADFVYTTSGARPAGCP